MGLRRRRVVQVGRPDQGVPLHQRVGLPPGRLGHLRPADPPAVDNLDWIADAGVSRVPPGHGPGDGAEHVRQPRRDPRCLQHLVKKPQLIHPHSSGQGRMFHLAVCPISLRSVCMVHRHLRRRLVKPLPKLQLAHGVSCNERCQITLEGDGFRRKHSGRKPESGHVLRGGQRAVRTHFGGEGPRTDRRIGLKSCFSASVSESAVGSAPTCATPIPRSWTR